MAHLVRLVIVDREPVPLAVLSRPWMFLPMTRTDPALGMFEPVISSKSVVFPDPFGPITPTIAESANVSFCFQAEGLPAPDQAARIAA